MNPLARATALLVTATEDDAKDLAGAERYVLRQQLRRWLDATDPPRDAPKAGVLSALKNGDRGE